MLRLPLRRGGRRARPARDARHAARRDDAPPSPAAGRRDHRHRGGRAPSRRDRRRSRPRPALEGVPEPAGVGVRVDPRRPDPRARAAGGRAQRPHPRAARVPPRRDRAAAGDREPGRPVDRPRAALRRGAAAGRRARGARPHLRGRLRVPLPRGVARGDRQDDDGRGARDRRGARARGRRDRLAGGPRRRATPSARRCAGSGARSASSWPTATRRSPTRSGRCSRRSPTTPPSRSSTAAR